MAKDINGKQLPKGITRRKDGRYMGRFEYQGEKFTFYNVDLKTLKKEMANKRYEVEHGIYAKEENVTVGSWFETWMTEYKTNNIKASTMQTYRHIFDSHIRGVIGKRKLKDVRSEMIQKLINDLFNQRFSKSCINMVHLILLGMYNQAKRNGIVKNNPVELTTLPKFRNQEERRVLSLEEQKLFLEYAEDSPYYDFYLLALCTGMRCGEILALEWSDVDFKGKTIRVTGTLIHLRGRGRFKDTPKTVNGLRDIPMLANVEAILRSKRKRQLETRIYMGGFHVLE